MRVSRFAGGLLVISSLTYAGAAFAQSSGGIAQSLFEEGVRLMRAKQYAEACPKLAESQRLEPAGGTVFNLALCLEEDGKLASAYVAFEEAFARAKKDGNTKRAQFVEARIAALKPKLSRVTITVANAGDGAAKPEVRFDGTPIGEQAWGVPFYADVGAHTITAEAPGKKAFRGELRVEAAGKQYDANVPALEDEPAPAPVVTANAPQKPEPPPKSEPPPATTSGRGPLPWILVGSGVALIGAGAVTGVLAFSKHSDSDAACPDGRCTAAGVDAEHQANTFAWVSNVTIPLGVIAAAAGVYLFIKKPSRTSAGTYIAPTLSGAVIHGAF